MRVVNAGTPCVGLINAVSLTHICHNVICLDVDDKKVTSLKKGQIALYERDLEKLMKENKVRLAFTTNYKETYKREDVIFISIATPEGSSGMQNLKYVYEVCAQISNSIIKDCIVVLKSTLPIGINKKIKQFINLNARYKVKEVNNPECLLQGSAVKNTFFATKIVVRKWCFCENI